MSTSCSPTEVKGLLEEQYIKHRYQLCLCRRPDKRATPRDMRTFAQARSAETLAGKGQVRIGRRPRDPAENSNALEGAHPFAVGPALAEIDRALDGSSRGLEKLKLPMPVLGHMGLGTKFLPISEELGNRAQLLADAEPEMWKNTGSNGDSGIWKG